MARKPTWRKADAQKALEAIAANIAEAFGVPVPAVEISPISGGEWELWINTLEVWTKSGAAELNVDIDADFAHLYFRFNDPARAVQFDDCMQRLNRHSGKWNRIATPRHSLSDFVAALANDFARVAERNPDPEDVRAFEAEKAARAAQWETWRAELAAERAAGLVP